MEMSDLVKLDNEDEDDEYDEKELKILSDAKIISGDQKGKRKHIVFAESAEEGQSNTFTLTFFHIEPNYFSISSIEKGQGESGTGECYRRFFSVSGV